MCALVATNELFFTFLLKRQIEINDHSRKKLNERNCVVAVRNCNSPLMDHFATFLNRSITDEFSPVFKIIYASEVE